MLNFFPSNKRHQLLYFGYLLLCTFYILAFLSIWVEVLREYPALLVGLITVVCFVLVGIILQEGKAVSGILWRILGLHVIISVVIYLFSLLILSQSAETAFWRLIGELEAAMIATQLLFMAGFIVIGAIVSQVMGSLPSQKEDVPTNV